LSEQFDAVVQPCTAAARANNQSNERVAPRDRLMLMLKLSNIDFFFYSCTDAEFGALTSGDPVTACA